MVTRKKQTFSARSALGNASDSSSVGSVGGSVAASTPTGGVDEEDGGESSSPGAAAHQATRSLAAATTTITAQQATSRLAPPAATAATTAAAAAQPERSPVARSRSPAAAAARTPQGARSSVSQAIAAFAPAFGGSTAERIFGDPIAPPTPNSFTPSPTPASPPLPPLPTLKSVGPHRQSILSVSERSSVTERRHADAQAALEKVEREIGEVEAETLVVEKKLEEAQEAIAVGGSQWGKAGAALATEEARLGRKEQQLRDKSGHLREEKNLLLRSQNSSRNELRRRASSSEGRQQKRVSFIMTQSRLEDPSEELAERNRVSRVEEGIEERSRSIQGGTPSGDEAGNDSVFHVYKIEEDPRLLVRLNAFSLPILVATLLSGFTLVLFDVAKTGLARRLTVLAFAVEMSASTMLCLIVFRGQQLYARATNIDQLTRAFLKRVDCVTVLALALFSVGMMVFVVAFVVEASEEMGAPWLAVLAVVLLPTVLAGVMFAVSTMKEARRKSWRESQPAGRRQTE